MTMISERFRKFNDNVVITQKGIIDKDKLLSYEKTSRPI